MRRSPVAVLCLGAVLLLGGICTSGKKLTIRIDEPDVGALLDDPTVHGRGRIALDFDLTTVEVRVDGVDLIDALGLEPPFLDKSGSVTIGTDTVTVLDFDFLSLDGPYVVSLALEGLPAAAHVLAMEGVKETGGDPIERTRPFDVVEPFGLAVDHLPAAARRAPAPTGTSMLLGPSLGQPLASPPVPTAGGDELRAGFPPAAGARIAGGSP